MKRKFFSCLMFSALIGAGMISVTSCADYDEDMKTLTQIVDNNTTLSNALQTQMDGMKSQISALEDALKAMKSCTCGDVDARIAEQIKKALASLNYTTPEQVAAAIDEALKGLNTGLTEAEVQALIETYHKAHPNCNCGDIEALIKKYLAENPGLSESDVEAIVKNYHDSHPGSSLTENDVKSIVETYINGLQHFTKEQIEGMINTAITQALANYVQKSEVYSESQIKELIKSAIEAYAATDSHGLDAEQVQKLIDAAIAKIQHPESGLNETEVTAIVTKAITEALKDINKGLATEEYVKKLVEEAKCNCPALTTDDVTSIASSVIAKYMEEHPYVLDTNAVTNIANAAIANSQIINNIQSSITTLQTTVQNIENDLKELKNNTYSKDEVKVVINQLIQQALADAVPGKTLSPEQKAIIEGLIAAAINEYNTAHPDCNCQFDATAFQQLVSNVAANTSAIQGLPDFGNFATKSELASAIEEVKTLIPAPADLSDYVTTSILNNAISEVNLSITQAKDLAQQALDKANENAGLIGNLGSQIGDINNQIGDINNQIGDINTQIGGINGTLTTLSNTIDTLSGTVSNLDKLTITLSEKLDDTYKRATTALDRSLSNYFEIVTLKSLYNNLLASMPEEYDDTELRNSIKNLEDKVDGLATKTELENKILDVKRLVNEARTYAEQVAAQALQNAKNYTDTKIGDLEKAYKDADEDLQNQINTINGKLTVINNTLKDLQDQIDLLKDLNKYADHLTKLITNIELQGSVNPTFGYFALPVGITSNVLIAYYGEAKDDIFFPAIDDRMLVYDEEANWITEDDRNRINGFEQFSGINGGWTVLGETGNAGKLYLTVNPSSVDFTGTKFTLVNSLGEQSPVTLGSLQPSKDKLTFGNTRGGAVNGFYEATATVKGENLESTKYSINPQITAALEDIAKNKLHANISNIAQAVYNQFNGNLDAYAVQAQWEDELGTHTVTSKYGIAATAIKPLGYSFMYGQNFKLPTITPLSELDIDLKKYIDLNKFSKEFKKDDLGINIKFDFSDIAVDESGNVVTDVVLIDKNKDYEQASFPVVLISASGVYTDPVTGETRTFTGYNRETAEWVAQIITNRADTWSAQLSKEFADNIEKLVDKVNSITAPGGTLQGTVDNLINNVQDKLNSLLTMGDSFISQLNHLITEVNDNFFGNGNPNLRLQAALFYPDALGFIHPMSTAKGIPTTISGSGEGIELSISSYNAEILVPSFKKYIAVTNVYRDGKTADNDPELMKALRTANEVQYFNEVLPGDRYAVVFTPDTSVSNATYEIVYSSLDYFGQISQRKYYVTVK